MATTSRSNAARIGSGNPGVPGHTHDMGDISGGGGGGGGVTDHGALTGLGDDDHTQYLTNGRGDVRYDAKNTASTAVAAHVALSDPHTQYLRATEVIAGTNVTVNTTTTPGSVIINSTAAAGGGVTDHGALTGLGDDDHPQYLKPSEVKAGSAITVDVNVNGEVTIASTVAAGLPAGGTAGQSLVKTSSTNYATSWATITSGGGGGVPTGGSTGQALVKTSSTDYATGWNTITGDTGVVELDSFAGANDSAKLAAAMTYAAAQTYKPTIRLPHGDVTLTTPINTMYRGFKLTGSGAGAIVEQPRSQNPYSTLVTYTGSGTLFALPNARYDGVSIGNIAFRGNSNAVFMNRASIADEDSQLATGCIYNVGFDSWKHVFGTPAVPFLMTAFRFAGYWNINAGTNTAITMGGSDNNFWLDHGLLLDSANPSFPANTPHMILNWMDMAYIGPIYMSCEPTYGGLKIISGTKRTLTFWGGEYGGRTPEDIHAFNAGALIDISGDCYTNFYSLWVGYTKSSTTVGAIRVRNGAKVSIRDPFYKPPTNPVANQLFANVDGVGSVLRISGAWDMGVALRATKTNSGTLTVDSSVAVV